MLQVRQLNLRYGGLQVLDRVDVDVPEHGVVGLIGPDGAGKTSFLDCLTGTAVPERGQVLLRGADLATRSAYRRVARGMAWTRREPAAVPGGTVSENVLAAQDRRARYGAVRGLLGLPGSWRRERELRRDAREILDYLDLLPYADDRVADLPYGVRKRCDLAMALATEPRLLVLDEPSAGLDPREAQQLGGTITALRGELGLSILLLEHHVPLVAGVCDEVYVLNYGQVLAYGPPDEIRRHPQVVAAYLEGAEHGAA